MTSGAEVRSVTPASSRAGSGGRPESTLAGTASPDQPIVTVGAEVGAGVGTTFGDGAVPAVVGAVAGALGPTAGDPPEHPAASSTVATQARPPPRRRIRAA
jgi:hypothetical protein